MLPAAGCCSCVVYCAGGVLLAVVSPLLKGCLMGKHVVGGRCSLQAAQDPQQLQPPHTESKAANLASFILQEASASSRYSWPGRNRGHSCSCDKAQVHIYAYIGLRWSTQKRAVRLLQHQHSTSSSSRVGLGSRQPYITSQHVQGTACQPASPGMALTHGRLSSFPGAGRTGDLLAPGGGWQPV
jgi:hypothetical protein